MKQNGQPNGIEVPIKIDWIYLTYEMCWVIWWPIELILNRMTLYSRLESDVFVTS
jgi:hypothetical protein